MRSARAWAFLFAAVAAVGCFGGGEPQVPTSAPGGVDDGAGAAKGDDTDTPATASRSKRPWKDVAPGKWRPARKEAHLSPEQLQLLEQLDAIGYADGTMEVVAQATITTHDRERAWAGWNLYCSGHAAEAFLVDMDGKVRHRWGTTFAEVFPAVKVVPGAPGTNHWRRAKLGPDGSLYGIFESRGLVKLDRDSTIVWQRSNRAHHDLVLLEGGAKLAVLTRESGLDTRLHPSRPILGDFIEILDAATGELVRRISLLDALLSSEHAGLVTEGKRRVSGDVLHTNSLQILDGRVAKANPAMTEGRVLLSMRSVSALGVVDLETERFVWLHQGDYKRQHDAEITDRGELLLFDNGGGQGGARVLAFDPGTMDVAWSVEHTKAFPLRSPTLGTVQQLPNGNVLITESEGGRALEVTRDGKDIVWEFYNPHRAGDKGQFIGALFELVRLPPDLDLSWAGE